jgi:hypothetical protein
MKLEAAINASPSPKDVKEETGEVCIANIDTKGRRQRLTFGIIQFVLAIVILTVLIIAGVDHLWRLPLFILFASGMVGYYQWHDKTCVAFARQGVFKLNGGIEKMEDNAQLAQVRRQARRVTIKAVLVAIPLTLLAFILPG